MTTEGCHTGGMAEKKADVSAHEETFQHLREVREEALRHMRLAQRFHAERRDILRGLIAEGFSQADIARELGVTRQAIQKMLAG
jgi:DNA-directed RNA polymerase specialized sigma24 family protein